jgi:putative ABC transport system permease protein
VPYALRIALRSLLRTPFLYLCAVLAIGLGIAAPTTMVTIANAVLRDLPVPEPERLVHISGTNTGLPGRSLHMSSQWFAALRERQTSLDGVAAHEKLSYDVGGMTGTAERRHAARVTPNTFGLLGIAPVLGRDFAPDDALPGAEPVVLISHDLWQSRLAGADAVTGTQLRLNGTPHTIIGVMPPGFRFPDTQQLWTTFHPTVDDAAHPIVGIFGRRPHDVSLPEVNAELQTIAASVHADHPDWTEGVGYRAQRYSHAMMDSEDRVILRALLVLFSFVLIIACANVANLLLARATARTQEVAVRAALGAGGRRLALEQFAEALWIAVPGGILGLLLARWGATSFASQLSEYMPFWVQLDLALNVLLFTAACIIIATLAAGLMPALQALRMDPQQALRDGGRGATFRIGRVARSLLVVQIALSVCLLILAAAMTRGVLALGKGDEFDAARIATAAWTLRGERYEAAGARRTHMDAMLGQVAGRPGVQQVAAASHLPDVWSGWRRVAFEGMSYDRPQDRPLVHEAVITPGYFAALGSAPLRGRDFDRRDVPDGELVAIVNRPFTLRYFDGDDPIGRRITLDDSRTDGPQTLTIVGEVPHLGVKTEEGDVAESIYLPYAQHPSGSMAFVVRTAGDASGVARELPRIAAAVDPDVALVDVSSLDVLIREARRTERAFGALFISIGAAALLLAAVGLAGVMAYAVRRRTRELGIRAALGASPARVLRAALGGSFVQLIIGGAAGTALGMTAAHVLGESMLLGMRAADRVVLTAVPLILLAVGAVAAWAPARYVTRIQVVDALRED